MDDNSALERQIGRVARQSLGPLTTVDVMGVARAAMSAAPRRGLSALLPVAGLVAAGIFVALFGAVLALGLLAQRDDDTVVLPAATAPVTPLATAPRSIDDAAFDVTVFGQAYPYLSTDEVEPGVFKVVAHEVAGTDQGHDLADVAFAAVELGPDGTPWVLEELADLDGQVGSALYTLDGSIRHEFPGTSDWSGPVSVVVAPDATIWALELPGEQLQSWDGTRWSSQSLPPHPDDVAATAGVRNIDLAPDGTLRLTRDVYRATPNEAVFSLVDGAWQSLPPVDDAALPPSWAGVEDNGTAPGAGEPAVASDGSAWIPTEAGVLHFDGASWRFEQPVAVSPNVRGGPAAVGRDGTVWAYWWKRRSNERQLARHDESGWTVWSAADRALDFTPDDGLPMLVADQVFIGRFAVDAAGTLWAYGHEYRDDEADEETCGGLLSFDGQTWRQYLRGSCISDVDIADDGTVWAASIGGRWSQGAWRGENHELGGLFVILPRRAANQG